MKKLIVLVTSLSLVIGSLLWAQGGPPGKGPGGPMTPKRQLGKMFRAVSRLEKKPLTKEQATKVLGVVSPWKTKTKMDDDQAKDLQKKLKPILNADQLNELDAMASQGFGGGRGGGGGPGGGGPGGGGPGGGPGKGGGGGMDEAAKAKMQLIRDKHKDDNPLNVSQLEASSKEMQALFPDAAKGKGKGKGGGFAGRGVQGMKDAWANLESIAKTGKPAKSSASPGKEGGKSSGKAAAKANEGKEAAKKK